MFSRSKNRHSTSKRRATINEISAAEAEQRAAEGDVHLVDVREVDEWAAAGLPVVDSAGLPGRVV